MQQKCDKDLIYSHSDGVPAPKLFASTARSFELQATNFTESKTGNNKLDVSLPPLRNGAAGLVVTSQTYMTPWIIDTKIRSESAAPLPTRPVFSTPQSEYGLASEKTNERPFLAKR
ncbi:hypothetical protein OK016_13215 [Vibrio chagasii]|nr:hypothetical protein [Vibrio chagasii]